MVMLCFSLLGFTMGFRIQKRGEMHESGSGKFKCDGVPEGKSLLWSHDLRVKK